MPINTRKGKQYQCRYSDEPDTHGYHDLCEGGLLNNLDLNNVLVCNTSLKPFFNPGSWMFFYSGATEVRGIPLTINRIFHRPECDYSLVLKSDLDSLIIGVEFITCLNRLERNTSNNTARKKNDEPRTDGRLRNQLHLPPNGWS